MNHSSSSTWVWTLLLLTGLPRLEAAEVPEGLKRAVFAAEKEVRHQAILAAPKFGADAIPVLNRLFLHDGSWSHAPLLRDERLRALNALAEIGHASAVPTLLVAAGDWEPSVRSEAQRQLLEIHGVTLAELRHTWLVSEDWFWRQGAMLTLFDHGIAADELAREAAKLVDDPSSDRRFAAVQAVGQLQSREGIACLHKVLGDAAADPAPRLEALGALHHLDGGQVPLEAWTLALGHEGLRPLYLATLSGGLVAIRFLEAAGAEAVPVLCRALEARS